MAGTTTNGLRYPQNTDTANIATDIQNLASDVQAYFLSKAPTTLADATVTKSWPSLELVAPTAESGIRYKASVNGTDEKYWGQYITNAAGGAMMLRPYTDALAQDPDYIAFNRDGNITITGTPTASTHVTPKSYVDQTVPSCRVYNNAANTLVAGVGEALTFNSERWDTHGMHSTVTNSERLTVPSGWDGYWLVGSNITFADTSSAAATTAFYSSITKNATDAISLQQHEPALYSTSQTVINQSSIVPAVGGDYFTCGAYQNPTVSSVAAGDADTWYAHDFWALFVSK